MSVSITKDNQSLQYYNSNDATVKPITLNLYSGFICPECNRTLLAYTESGIPEKSFEMFCESKDNLKDYSFMTHAGGQIISISKRAHTCKQEIVSEIKRGAKANVISWAKQKGAKEDVTKLIEMVKDKTVPGLKLVMDVTGNDSHILLYNHIAFENEANKDPELKPVWNVDDLIKRITGPIELKEKNVEFNEPLFKEEDIISMYTRAEALADGTLIDISEAAKEKGFKSPVAMTAAVHALITPPESQPTQDYLGRLHDMVWMMFNASKKNNSDHAYFKVIFLNNEGKPETVQLKSIIGAKDINDPSPAITVMLMNED